VLGIADALALASALGADPADVAGLLPDIRAGMIAGLAKAHREADRHG
jgi:hypothetical protein